MQRKPSTLIQLADNTLKNPGYNLFVKELRAVLSLHGTVSENVFNKAIIEFYVNKAQTPHDKQLAEKVAKLLITAIQNRKSLIKQWPEIRTLEELVAAQQKITYLMLIETIAKRCKENENEHAINGFNAVYEDFRSQLLGSDTLVSLQELLAEDSLFLKTPLKIPGTETKTLTLREKVGKKETLTKVERNILEPVMVVQSRRPELIQKEATIKDFLMKVTDGKFYHDTCTLNPNLIIRGKVNPFEKDCHKECLNLHNALIEMREKYLSRGRKTHREDIDNLISDVTKIINNKDPNEDYYGRHGKIMNAIRTAYRDQEYRFTHPLYFSCFAKPKEAFERQLDKPNDKAFWYPRLLKDILNKDISKELHIRNVTQNIKSFVKK